MLDKTGPVGFTGVEGQKGIDLAVEQANAAKALGGATLAVDVKDGALGSEAGREPDDRRWSRTIRSCRRA